MQFSSSNRHIFFFLIISLLFVSFALPQTNLFPSDQELSVVLAGESQALANQEIILIDSENGSTTRLQSDANGQVRLPAHSQQSRLLYPLTKAEHNTQQYLHGSLEAGKLQFDPQQILTTFPVTISLEWQPGKNGRDLATLEGCTLPTSAQASYVEDLEQAMRSASAYLYDVSEGQMTFGDIMIYTGGEYWDEADIRILANNNYRPSALIGGHVKQHTPTTNADKSLDLRFRPGQILLGRQWDGQSGACGPWSSPAGVRTIVHEWMHYALNLWDEYLKPLEGKMSYCSNDNLPAFQADINQSSMMAYHYTSNALWGADVEGQGLAAVPQNCLDTDQMLVHNRSDWETIAFYFPSIKMPDPKAGQNNQRYDASGIVVKLPDLSSALDDTNTTVAVSMPNEGGFPLVAENYLLVPRSQDDPLPKRMMGQGILFNKEPSSFLGVQEEHTLRSLAIDPLTNERYAFPFSDLSQNDALLKPGSVQDFELADNVWKTEILLRPILNREGDVNALELIFADCDVETRTIEAVYCPAGGECGEPVRVSMANNRFQAILSKPDELIAFHGYIYIREVLKGRWTATWYQLGGGVGPAHADGHTPMADGLVSVNVPMGSLGSADAHTATLYMPTQRCSLPEQNDAVSGPVFPPIELVLVRNNELWGYPSPHIPINVHFAYNPRLIARLGLSVNDLSLISHSGERSGKSWNDTPLAGRNSQLGVVSIDREKAESNQIYFNGRNLISLGFYHDRPSSGPDQNHRLSLPLVQR
jgi:hypothetical protein